MSWTSQAVVGVMRVCIFPRNANRAVLLQHFYLISYSRDVYPKDLVHTRAYANWFQSFNFNISYDVLLLYIVYATRCYAIQL